MSIELKLSRASRIYHPSEPLEGKIIVKSSSSISHYGVRLTVNGSVNLQIRGGSAGIIESLYGVVKPISILNKSTEVRPSGKIGLGTTETQYYDFKNGAAAALLMKEFNLKIPFSMFLRQPGKDNLERFYETFHGANISAQYLVTVDIIRGYLHKTLSATVEFIVESDKDDLLKRPVSPEMVIFYITQDTQRHPLLLELKSGGFRVTGKMSTQCSLSDPITGEVAVEASAVPIYSIDIHLLRVESILLGEKIVTETSLIQSTQASDGDVCHNMTLPIYVILPRLLTCPTILAGKGDIDYLGKSASWQLNFSGGGGLPLPLDLNLPSSNRLVLSEFLHTGVLKDINCVATESDPSSSYQVKREPQASASAVTVAFVGPTHHVPESSATASFLGLTALESLPLELVRTR
uniref:Uncharacterized protein n=1 Tax=Quercus lobata TaxID=97700 RepID=A0A7N2RC06_QUELO